MLVAFSMSQDQVVGHVSVLVDVHQWPAFDALPDPPTTLFSALGYWYGGHEAA